MRIKLEGVPPSLNRFAGRSNTWEYRAAKKQWTDAVMLACRIAGNGPDKPLERAKVEIVYYFPTRSRHDADNYAGKFLLDGLTKAGVIVDDDLKHITTTIRGEYDKDWPRTEIEIQEV